MKNFYIIILTLVALLQVSCNTPDKQIDICIYSETSVGVIAAYTAAQSGKPYC